MGKQLATLTPRRILIYAGYFVLGVIVLWGILIWVALLIALWASASGGGWHG